MSKGDSDTRSKCRNTPPPPPALHWRCSNVCGPAPGTAPPPDQLVPAGWPANKVTAPCRSKYHRYTKSQYVDMRRQEQHEQGLDVIDMADQDYSTEPCKVYLCLLDSSSGLGVQPTGTRRKLSRRLSTVTEFMWTTWKLGAMPPLCFSLLTHIQNETQKLNVTEMY